MRKKINLNEAREIANTYVASYVHRLNEGRYPPNIKMVITDFYIEDDECFVIGYKYLEETTDGLKDCLMAGGGPILIDRETGKIHRFPSYLNGFNSIKVFKEQKAEERKKGANEPVKLVNPCVFRKKIKVTSLKDNAKES
jgi:hypothetical protein